MFTLKNKRNHYDWIVNSFFLINVKKNTKYNKFTQLSLYLSNGIFYYLKYVNLFIQFKTLKQLGFDDEFQNDLDEWNVNDKELLIYVVQIINRLITNNISNFYKYQSIIFKHWLAFHLNEYIVYMPKENILEIIEYITSILNRTDNLIELQDIINNFETEEEELINDDQLDDNYYSKILDLNKMFNEYQYKYHLNIKQILKNVVNISKKKPFFSKKNYFDYNYYQLSLFLLSVYGYTFKTLKLFYNKYKDKYLLETFNDFLYLINKKIDHFFNLYFNITNEELQFIIKTQKLLINNQILKNTNLFITDITFIELKSNNHLILLKKKIDIDIFNYKKWYILNYFFFFKSMLWNKNFYNNLIVDQLKKNIINLVFNINNLNSNNFLEINNKFKKLTTNKKLFKSTVLHIIDIIPIIYYNNILQHKNLFSNLNSLSNINIIKYFISKKNSTNLTISKYKNFSNNLIRYIQKMNDLYNILYIIYKLNNYNYKYYINYIIYTFFIKSTIQLINYNLESILNKNKIENYFNLYNIQQKEIFNIQTKNDYLIIKIYNRFIKKKKKKKKILLNKLILKIRKNKQLIKSYESDVKYEYDESKIFIESKLIYDELKKYNHLKNKSNNLFFVNEYKNLYRQLYQILSCNNDQFNTNKFIYSKKNFYYINILPKKNIVLKNWFNNYFINNYRNKLMSSFF